MSASQQRALLVVVLVLFGALTLVGFLVDGFPTAVVDAITFNWHSVQIFVDLALAIAAICVWIFFDARKRNRNPWPWIVAAAIVGMFSPLVYFFSRSLDSNADALGG